MEPGMFNAAQGVQDSSMYASDTEDDFVPDFIESKRKLKIPSRINEADRDAPPSPTEGSFLCQVCGDLFQRKNNADDACQFHFGKYSAEDEAWTCCGKAKLAPGCKKGRHQDSETLTFCQFCLKKMKSRDLATHQEEECSACPKSPQSTRSGSTMCERCNHVFARNANRDSSCVFHPGELGYVSSQDVVRRWNCCGLQEGTENEFTRGCVQSFHLDANRVADCTYCGESVQVKEMQKHHLEDCARSPQRAMVACSYCEEKVPQASMERHHQSSCPKYPSVNCPQREHGCPLQMLQAAIPEHLKQCIARPIPCTFHKAGCTATVPHNKLEHHIASDVSNHMILMWNAFEAMSTRLEQLAVENESLKSKLSS